jgi:hypothetical protein
MSSSNVNLNSSGNYPGLFDYTDLLEGEADPFEWNPPNDTVSLFQSAFKEGFDTKPAKDLSQLSEDVPSGPMQVIGLRGGWLVEAIRKYYKWTLEDLQRALEQIRYSCTVSSINIWERNDKIFQPAAEAFGSLFKLDADLFYCNAKEKKTCQAWDPPLLEKPEKPVQRSGNLDGLIGLRGVALLKAIRAYYGWTLEDLRRQLKQTQNKNYAWSTIIRWESTDEITRPAAKALGSLFRLDADLFYSGSKEKKTFQTWDPPSFK